MSIRKSGRPLLKLKTTSPLIAPAPTLTQDSSKTKVDFEVLEEKSDEEMTDFVPTRPLSVAIPRSSAFTTTGPYCPRRPHLSDILANNSPPPWTLSAFMAYLSQNHCLETLEFTMDASRYRKHFTKMSSRSSGGQLTSGTNEGIYILSLWQKLIEAYIVPNGPREVNIPSEVRDSLISLSNAQVPPDPSVLDIAVQKVYELMEESVLVPFLNSVYPQTAHSDYADNVSQEDLASSAYPSSSYDERAMYRRSTRRERRSSPPFASSMPASAPAHNRSSAPSTFSQFARNFSHSARHISNSSSGSHPSSARASSSAILSPWSSNQSDSNSHSPADLSAGGLTDDTPASSPSAFGEPMTPPTTPPQCEYSSPVSASVPPTYGSKKETGAWKKVRSSFGFRKKSGSLREEELDSTGHFT